MDMTYYKKYEPIFGDWRIVREIGSGSFGKVFEIEREDFGYTYKAALKAVTIPQSQSEVESIMDDGMDEQSATKYFRGFVEELVEEFRLMSKLKGESNIVSYEDHRVIEHTDGIGWDILIRMELLTPLMKYTKEHSLTQQDVIKLGVDICKALELCRKHKIIHRDIKPENIFVSENGKFKLGDFGIARTVEKTQSGLSKKGTYYYMAPEVYKGEKYGASVDIYSLGIVLYRYLNNNRVPFLPPYPAVMTHTDRANAIERRVSGEAIPAPANADKKLADIVLKACAYDPKDRYASATEMREALEALTVDFVPAAAVVPELASEPEEGTMSETLDMPFDKTAYINDEPTQADTKKAPMFAPQAKQEAAVSTKKRLTPKYLAAAAVVAIVIITSAVALGGGSSPSQSEKEPAQTSQAQPTQAAVQATVKPTAKPSWSDWTEKLPSSVSKKDYQIEEKKLYRSKDKETKTSTTSSKLDGWTLTETADKGEYGAWSDWSSKKVSQTSSREVQNETRYRSRSLQTTTSSSSSLSGWELYDTTYSWSNYGGWSDWSTSYVSGSDSRKVESKTQYRYRNKSTSQQYTSWSSWSGWQEGAVSSSSTREVQTRTIYAYYYYLCPRCGAHMHCWDVNCPTWAGGCGKQYISSGDWREHWSTTPHSSVTFRDWHGTGKVYAYVDGQLVFKWTDGMARGEAVKTQYSYRTRSLENVTNYGDWSGWGDTAYSNSSSRDVQTRTVYRYCDRQNIATYHFRRWGSWSNWTAQKLSGSGTKQVESATFYRYRDKTSKKTYVFTRWSDWTEWSETPMYKSDDRQVETKSVFRYKLK